MSLTFLGKDTPLGSCSYKDASVAYKRRVSESVTIADNRQIFWLQKRLIKSVS